MPARPGNEIGEIYASDRNGARCADGRSWPVSVLEVDDRVSTLSSQRGQLDNEFYRYE
jgi:hypothetical protein